MKAKVKKKNITPILIAIGEVSFALMLAKRDLKTICFKHTLFFTTYDPA